MNDQLKAKLLEWMGGLEKASVAAMEFSKNELPDLFKQIALFGAYKHGICLLIAALLLASTPFLLRRMLSDPAKGADPSGQQILCFIGIVGAFLTSVIIVADNLSKFVMCVVAPKLYILEYMRELLK